MSKCIPGRKRHSWPKGYRILANGGVMYFSVKMICLKCGKRK